MARGFEPADPGDAVDGAADGEEAVARIVEVVVTTAAEGTATGCSIAARRQKVEVVLRWSCRVSDSSTVSDPWSMACRGRLCHGGLVCGKRCVLEKDSWRRVCQDCLLEPEIDVPASRCRVLVTPSGEFSASRTCTNCESSNRGPPKDAFSTPGASPPSSHSSVVVGSSLAPGSLRELEERAARDSQRR